MRFYRVKQWLAAGLTAVLLSGCLNAWNAGGQQSRRNREDQSL